MARLGPDGLLAAAALHLLGGCGHPGPAWPRSAGTVAVIDWKTDGGESIDPPAASVTSVVEASSEPPPVAVEGPVAPMAATATPAAVEAPVVPIELPAEQIDIDLDADDGDDDE